MLSKFLQLIKSHQYHIFLAICIGLISSISYNLGQINSLKKVPISIKESTDLKAEIFDAANSKSQTLNKLKTQKIKSKKLIPESLSPQTPTSTTTLGVPE